jgi:hypothetical protein
MIEGIEKWTRQIDGSLVDEQTAVPPPDFIFGGGGNLNIYES